MYRLNSLNADIQLIVDGAWGSKTCVVKSLCAWRQHEFSL